jgi:TorA maturation chaperone TorD
VHLRDDPAIISFAADALLPTKGPLLLAALKAAEELGQSDDSRELIVILRDSIEKDVDVIEAECSRLFVGPPEPVCPPWQSAYIENIHSAEATYASALRWHEYVGLGSKTESQPADHAALLLNVYARLLELGAYDEALNRFHREHMAWMPRFLRCVADETTLLFYRRLAVWLAAEIGDAPTAA